MKKAVLLLFVFATVCCAAQQPDVECFSVGYVDTLNSNYADTIRNLREANTLLLKDPVLMYDQVVNIWDSTGYQCEVTKKGNDFWFSLIQDDQRFRVNVVDNQLEVWVGDSTKAINMMSNLCLPLLFEQVHVDCPGNE